MKDTECEEVDRRRLQMVLKDFEDILADEPGCCKELSMDIRLAGDAQPFALCPYKITNKLKKGVQEELQALMQQDIIEESNEEWASPLVPVVKHSALWSDTISNFCPYRKCVQYSTAATTPKASNSVAE